jgi:plasmid stabilization system protein ParE
MGALSLPVFLDPEAQDEFDQGYDYREGQRVVLGEKFADAVQAALNRIEGMPRWHRAVFGDLRRAVVQGLPYCVDCREEPSRVRVLSVFLTKRHPNIWQSRA